MIELLSAIGMFMFGVWFIFLSYFGPYTAYKNDRTGIVIVTKDDVKMVTVRNYATGKTKTYSYKEYLDIFMNDLDSNENK